MDFKTKLQLLEGHHHVWILESSQFRNTNLRWKYESGLPDLSLRQGTCPNIRSETLLLLRLQNERSLGTCLWHIYAFISWGFWHFKQDLFPVETMFFPVTGIFCLIGREKHLEISVHETKIWFFINQALGKGQLAIFFSHLWAVFVVCKKSTKSKTWCTPFHRFSNPHDQCLTWRALPEGRKENPKVCPQLVATTEACGCLN